MLTRERFEHELLKIKGQVGPEHVGRIKSLGAADEERCIIGQMVHNFGALKARKDVCEAQTQVWGYTVIYHQIVLNGPLWPYGWLWADAQHCDFVQTEPVEPAVYKLARRAVEMNDAGIPWHQIVDALVPQVKEPVLSAEPECEAVCQ